MWEAWPHCERPGLPGRGPAFCERPCLPVKILANQEISRKMQFCRQNYLQWVFFVAENIYAYKQGPTSSENCVPRPSRNFLGLLARTLFVLYSFNINDTSLPTGTSLTNGFSHLLKYTECFKTAVSLLRVHIIIYAIMGKYQASKLISIETI